MRKSVNPIFWLLLKRSWPECHNSLMIHFSKRIRATNGSFAEALFFCKHLQRFKSLQLHFGFSYMENKDILNLCTLVSSWEYGWFCSYSQDTRLFCNTWLVGEHFFYYTRWFWIIEVSVGATTPFLFSRLTLPCYWTSSLSVWKKYWLSLSFWQLFWDLYL